MFKNKKKLKNFILLSVSIAIFLVLSEILCRFIIEKPLETDYNLTIKSDNRLIRYKLIPNFTGKILGKDIKINPHGFREFEYPQKKEENVFRIAILGDSLTFGYGVNLNETYPKILENKLKTLGNYEVLNFGVSGYNTAQEAELLATTVLNYSPDLIIIGFFYNDFDKPQEIMSKNNFFQEMFYNVEIFFYKNSLFYKFLKFNLRTNMFVSSLFHKLTTVEHYETIINEKGVEYQYFNNSVHRIKEITYKNNVPVIWLSLPHITLAEPYPLRYVYDSVDSIAENYGFTVIDLYKEVNMSFLDLRLDTLYDSHPNVKYYNLTANVIYNKLVLLGYIN